MVPCSGVRVKGNAQNVEEKLKEAGAIVDFREPDILRNGTYTSL